MKHSNGAETCVGSRPGEKTEKPMGRGHNDQGVKDEMDNNGDAVMADATC